MASHTATEFSSTTSPTARHGAAAKVFGIPELLDMIILEAVITEAMEMVMTAAPGDGGFTKSDVLGWLKQRLSHSFTQLGSDARHALEIQPPLSHDDAMTVHAQPQESTADATGLVRKLLYDNLRRSEPSYVLYNEYDSIVSRTNRLGNLEHMSNDARYATGKTAVEESWIKAGSGDMPELLISSWDGKNTVIAGFSTRTPPHAGRREKLWRYLELVEHAVSCTDFTADVIVVRELETHRPVLRNAEKSDVCDEIFERTMEAVDKVTKLAGAHCYFAQLCCGVGDEFENKVVVLDSTQPIDNNKLDFIGHMINQGLDFGCQVVATISCGAMLY